MISESSLLFRVIRPLIVLLLCCLAAWPLYSWIFNPEALYVVKMLPGLDGKPVQDKIVYDDDLLYPERVSFSNPNIFMTAGEWPQFRGPARNAIAEMSPPLLSETGSTPDLLWTVELGEGHAAPVVSSGRVFVLDYNETTSSDSLRCFSLETGEEIWRQSYPNPIKRNHGRSRSIPAVSDSVVVSIGPSGDILAAGVEDGEFLWGFSLVKRYGTIIPLWYGAQCPLIEDNKVYAAPGGDYLLVAYDLSTGEILWEAPNERNWQMSHASLMTADFHGTRQIILSMLGGIAGYTMEGEELWFYPWNPAVIAPSPLVIQDNMIIQSAGYGVGTLILEIHKTDNVWTSEMHSEYLPGKGLSTEQQTAVLFKDRLWAVLPKDAGGFREQFVCADFKGGILWTSGQEYRFGLGPWIIADNKFFILSDDGILTAAEADPEEWKPLWSAKVLKGIDAWGPPAFAGGLLLVRDSRWLRCLDLRIDGGNNG